jgi:hypothetical protein
MVSVLWVMRIRSSAAPLAVLEDEPAVGAVWVSSNRSWPEISS